MNSPDTAQPGPSSMSVGDCVGHYRLTQLLVSGSHSDVWLAVDDLLGQQVAVKQLIFDSGHADAQTLRQRFVQEAQTQKQVSSLNKHLIKLIDLIENSDGLFIVMEYVDGPSMDQILQSANGPYEHRNCLGILAAIARALQTLHDHGIVHRDLKPSNIIMPRSGGLKVCDFGLATLLDDQDVMTIGSVRYMAPEMFSGKPIDHRADLYALGMIAYEMMAGAVGFERAFKVVLRDQRNQSLRWMKWHTNLRARPMALEKLNLQAPPAICQLIGRLMEKDPSNRIASAEQLIDAIRRQFSGSEAAVGPVAISPSATPRPMRVDDTAPTAALPRQSRWPWVAGGCLVLVTLLGLSPVAYNRYQLQQAAMHAQAEARSRFRDGRSAFEAGRYADAQTIFNKLEYDYGDDEPFSKQVASQCKAYGLMCEAHLDHQAGDYASALKKVEQADSLAVIGNRDLIVPFQQLIMGDQAFKQVTEQIATAIELGQIDHARSQLREQFQRHQTLTDHQQTVLADLGSQVETLDARRSVQKTQRQVQTLLGQGDMDQAIALLDFELERQSNRSLQTLLDSVRQQQQLTLLQKRVDDALEEDNIVAGIRYLLKMDAIEKNTQRTAQLRQLQGRQAFAQGNRLKEAGDLQGAKQAYLQALALGHQGAQTQLSDIQVSGQVQTVLTAGDIAYANGQYESAVAYFQHAIKLGAIDQASDRLKLARLQLSLTRADQALQAGQLGQARTHFLSVLQLDNQNTLAIKGLEILATRNDYLQLLAKGDDAQKRGQLGTALRWYAKAKKVLPNKAIASRIGETQYELFLSQARYYIETGYYRSALAKLVAASHIDDSVQVNDLLKQVKMELAKEDEGDGNK